MYFLKDSSFFMALLVGANSLPSSCNLGDLYCQSFWPVFTALLLVIVGMSFQPFGERAERSKEEMQQDAKATIEPLLSEFGNKLKAEGAKQVAAIYIRYSTGSQDSFEAQLRPAFNNAAAMGVSVSTENIFFSIWALRSPRKIEAD